MCLWVFHGRGVRTSVYASEYKPLDAPLCVYFNITTKSKLLTNGQEGCEYIE